MPLDPRRAADREELSGPAASVADRRLEADNVGGISLRSLFSIRLAGFLIVAAAGVCASACGRTPEVPRPAVLRIGVGAPPKGTPGTGVRAVVNLMRGDTWLSTKPDGRPGERVATTWEWDDAGTTLRLHLRNDVLFHDGSKLTAQMAAESLRYSAQRWQTEAISFSSVTDVTPAGDSAVDIHLRERNGFVLTDLTTSVITKPDNPNIGTGPFKIDRTDAQGASLSAFPQYFRGRPSLAGVTVVNYPTQRNAWSALMRGDVDMLFELSLLSEDFVVG